MAQASTVAVHDVPAMETEPNSKSQDVKKEEQEEEDCGFCKFMKAGPCGEQFSAWQDCVKESRADGRDFVQDCVGCTESMTECMQRTENKSYYEAIDDELSDNDENADTGDRSSQTPEEVK